MTLPKLKNNAVGYLISGINSSATTINLLTGQGARFPDLADGEYFYATLVRSSDRAVEIVKVTGKTGDAMTAVRAQEGTAALSFSAADMFEMRLTVQTLTDLMDRASEYVDGVTAAALHRSPAAITAMFVYDTSKDSDGGAWTEKCQHTSWYNEPINGKWLGAHASEAAARAVGTTGDYFQLTTNGQFFSLNAGSGTTETFRGNKRDFPRLAAIVAEAASVTIYDLTEKGVDGSFPMWMRFIRETSYPWNGGAAQGLSALNGTFALAGAWSLLVFNFGGDKTLLYHSSPTASGEFQNNIALRHTTRIGNRSIGLIASSDVRAVAMTVLPDAPVDPVSGLAVPTIAIGTTGGISVIKDDGTVVSRTGIGNTPRIAIPPDHRVHFPASLNGNLWHYTAPIRSLQDNFGYTLVRYNTTGTDSRFLDNITSFDAPKAFSVLIAGTIIGRGGVNLLKSPGVKSPAVMTSARIQYHYATGHQPGDIRRTYLSDTEVGSVGPSVELVTNGTFDVDASGWTPSTANVTATRNASGQLEVTNNGAGWVSQTINTVAGRTYRVEVNWLQKQSGGRFRLGNSVGSDNLGGTALAGNYTGATALSFVASGTTAVISLGDSASAVGVVQIYDNISVREVVADRSYKNQGIVPYGTLTRSPVATDASLVAYEGWSGTDYLQEPYSADLNFGTGEWSVSAWANIPAVLPPESFPVIGGELSTLAVPATVFRDESTNTFAHFGSVVAGKSYKLVFTISSNTGLSATLRVDGGGGRTDPGLAVAGGSTGTFTLYFTVLFTGWLGIQGNGPGVNLTISEASLVEVSPALIADRAYSSGASLHLGVNASGRLQATAFDGTTTRTVTTTTAYNNATWIKPEAVYTTDGTLAIRVNGQEIAATRGNPLLTLNNSDAVLTIGNSYTLDAPFPGKLALVKLSATVPTAEQSIWMYEQEKQLFREGAKCVLPDAGALVDLAYDEATDKWMAASASNISEWSGLVRTNVIPSPAGSYSKLASGGGVVLSGRTTTSPGVDVTIPEYALREELVKRAEAAARMNANLATFDYVGGFTANTTDTSTAVTSVAGLAYPASYIGAKVTGSGIPADTVVSGVSGTTIYLSKPATATATGVQIAFVDFALPVGYEAKRVSVAGAAQQEGATKNYQVLFDGFRETVRFGVAPAHDSWVQVEAGRNNAQ